MIAEAPIAAAEERVGAPLVAVHGLDAVRVAKARNVLEHFRCLERIANRCPSCFVFIFAKLIEVDGFWL